MAVTIDSLELKITHDSADAVKGINSLVRSLKRLKEVAGMGADLVEVAKAIRVIKQATSKSDVAKGTVSAMKQIKQATNDATQACDAHVRAWQHYLDVQDRIKDMKVFDGNAPSGENHYVQREVQLQGTGMTDASYWSGWKEHIDSFKTKAQLAAEARELAKQEKAEEKATTEELVRQKKIEDDIVNAYRKKQEANERLQQKEAKQAYKDSVKKQAAEAKEAQMEMSQLVGVFSKFGGIALKIGGKIMEGITAPFKKAIAGYKRLVSMVKRMVLRRIIMAALKVITDGFKTGLENLYQYSYAMNGLDSSHAYKNLDALATAAMYVKNSVGAAAMPVINMFIPVLQRLASWAAMAANAVNQLVSALSGGDTYTRAKEYAVDYMDGVKDSASGAGKAAKDLKATLLGFDEINRLDSADKGSGSGGGGGGSAKLDYSSMFEEAKIDKAFKDFTDQIKQKIEAGDWSDVGELIGDKLNESVDSINAKDIGKSITTKISNGAKLVAGFLKKTNFKKIGAKIEDFIHGAIEGIDAEAFADTISGIITGALDLFIGFVTEAGRNGTARTLGEKLHTFITTALDNLRDYIKKENWLQVGYRLGETLGDFIVSADFPDLILDFMDFLSDVLIAASDFTIAMRAAIITKLLENFAGKQSDYDSTAEWMMTGLIKGIVQFISFSSTLIGKIGIAFAQLMFKDFAKWILGAFDELITDILSNPVLVAVLGLGGSVGLASAHLAIVDALERINEETSDWAELQGLVNQRLTVSETSVRKYSKGAKDTYYEIQQSAQKAAGAVGGINNIKFDSVVSRLLALKKEITKIAGSYNISFKVPAIKGQTGNYGQGTMYASGGFPTRGEMFIAGEQGAELVGSINGRTAVVSGGEISGISAAVYATGEREVAAINNLIRALNQKDMTAVVSTDSIVSGLARKNRRDGVSTVPVSV